MNGERRPEAKLGLGQVQGGSNRRKRDKATELSRNTVPRETAISSSLALVMGAIAAMALPPQIAVPAVMRNEAVALRPGAFPAPSPTAWRS